MTPVEGIENEKTPHHDYLIKHKYVIYKYLIFLGFVVFFVTDCN